MLGFYTKIKNHILLIATSSATKDTFLLSILQVVVQLNSLLAVFFVARYLGPTNLGLISFTQTFVSFTFFANAGLYAYYAYELAARPTEKKQIVDTFFKTQTVVNGLACLVSLVVLETFHLPLRETVLTLASLAISYVGSTASFLSTFLLVEKRVREYVTGGLFSSCAILVARIVGIYFSLPVEYFALILALESIVLFMLLRTFNFVTRADLPRFTIPTLKETWREVYKAKYFIGLISATLVFSRIDQLYIKDLLTNNDLGLYSAAVRLTEYPSVLMGILGSVLMPRVSEAVNPILRKKVIVTGFFIYTLLGFCFSVILVAFGSLFVHILYGAKFLEAANVLSIYAFVIPGLWLINFSTIIFGAFNKIKYGFIISLFGGIISVGFLTFLVPAYGLSGAAMSAVIAYWVTAIISLLFSYHVSKHIFVTSPKIPNELAQMETIEKEA